MKERYAKAIGVGFTVFTLTFAAFIAKELWTSRESINLVQEAEAKSTVSMEVGEWRSELMGCTDREELHNIGGFRIANADTLNACIYKIQKRTGKDSFFTEYVALSNTGSVSMGR